MGHWGKMIFGGLGAAIGGPIGAGLGALAGHYMFDEENEASTGSEMTRMRRRSSAKKGGNLDFDGAEIQYVYFCCLISVMAKMAKADGRVCEKEVDVFKGFMKRSGFDKQTREMAIEIFNQAKTVRFSAKRYLDQLASITGDNQEFSGFLLYNLLAFALADGEIHPKERKILNDLEKSFGFPSGTVQNAIDGVAQNMEGTSPKARLDEAYELLGCTPDMPDKEIKKQYRSKCVNFHPDKIQGKGLPDEFTQFANQQMLKINEAYDTIIKSRRKEK
jgi:DnaJ like chaperone protein